MGSKIAAMMVSALAVLVACSSNGSGGTLTTDPTTTTTEPRPSEVCSEEPDIAIDTEALAVESIVVDVDGDGFDDTVTGYLLGSSDSTAASAAVIHLELGSGWGTAVRIDELGLADGPAMAQPRTVVNMGDDRLIVAGVSEIARGQLFAFFAFDDCKLSVVYTSAGEIPEIWVGGGRTHDDWFVCESDRVLMVQFGTSNPEAEPKRYGAGAAQTYDYAEGEFTRARSSDIDAALPATRDQMARIYPPCVD